MELGMEEKGDPGAYPRAYLCASTIPISIFIADHSPRSDPQVRQLVTASVRLRSATVYIRAEGSLVRKKI